MDTPSAEDPSHAPHGATEGGEPLGGREPLNFFMTRSVWTYDWELVHDKLPCSGCISKLQSCRESSLVLLIYPGLMVENPPKIVFSGACRFRPFQVFMGENKA